MQKNHFETMEGWGDGKNKKCPVCNEKIYMDYICNTTDSYVVGRALILRETHSKCFYHPGKLDMSRCVPGDWKSGMEDAEWSCCEGNDLSSGCTPVTKKEGSL